MASLSSSEAKKEIDPALYERLAKARAAKAAKKVELERKKHEARDILDEIKTEELHAPQQTAPVEEAPPEMLAPPPAQPSSRPHV
jgi:hypothetical protein